MINFSSNKLSGVIPCFSGQYMDNLEYLHLNDNELHGEIPSCLSGGGSLKILDVGENKLTGLVPSGLKDGTLSKLNVLRLSHNKFNGTIPDEMCSLSFLRVLDLSSNQLTGNIPSCFGNLTGINNPLEDTYDVLDFQRQQSDPYAEYKFIKLANENSVYETIVGIAREYSTNLKLFTTIDLSCNHLEGAIPEELTKLSGLIALILDQNHLTGNIPEKIGDMRALETLDLSSNNLCGRIPTSLGNIDTLSHINFSFNNLSGQIPADRHIDTLDDPSVYAGNQHLCGNILLNKCSSNVEQPIKLDVEDEDEVEDKNEKLWFYLFVMLGFAIGFWGIVGTLWFKKSWRHALFNSIEDIHDWIYVCIALKMFKLKKWMEKESSEK